MQDLTQAGVTRNGTTGMLLSPYPGRIVHYLAGEEQVAFSPDPRHGWKEMALGGVETVKLPCRQANMLQEPYVRDLAEHLAESLEQV